VADLDENSWKPAYKRQKVYSIGLTGLTIIQDFTNTNRVPRDWSLTLRVFIATPWPDATWGKWSDLLAAFNKPTVTYIEHDGTTHTVGIQKPLIPRPRTGANILGECYGVFFVSINLIKVYT
jgi:hypothetical protein